MAGRILIIHDVQRKNEGRVRDPGKDGAGFGKTLKDFKGTG